jgi:cytochrome P450
MIFSGLGAVLMDGGADTTASYLQTFVTALLQSPESQLKAQQEIDNVIGRDRLPVLEDFKCLPYVMALVKEVSLNLSSAIWLLQFVINNN